MDRARTMTTGFSAAAPTGEQSGSMDIRRKRPRAPPENILHANLYRRRRRLACAIRTPRCRYPRRATPSHNIGGYNTSLPLFGRVFEVPQSTIITSARMRFWVGGCREGGRSEYPGIRFSEIPVWPEAHGTAALDPVGCLGKEGGSRAIGA